jgi:hypothetical protein
MKKFLTLSMMVLFCSGLQAQPVLTSSFNPVTGDHWKFHPVNTSITPGASGANVTWDFSNIHVIYNPVIGNYISPSATPYAADFPTATVAYEAKGAPGSYHYYKASANKLENLGEASVMFTIQYVTPFDIYTYPFSFGTTVSQNFVCSTQVGSLDLVRTGTWSVTGDGYGTLILPTGIRQNILRVKTERVRKDDYSGGVGEQRIDYIDYLWIDPNDKVPLLMILTEIHYAAGSPFDTLTSVRISDVVSGIGQHNMSFSGMNLYPNPASDMATLTFDLLRPGRVTIDAYTVDGRRVMEGTPKDLPSGSHRHDLRLDGLQPGYYLLKVRSEEASVMISFLKL